MLHHSDWGVQWAVRGYVSVAARGQPKQNPHAERVIRTTKEEAVYLNDHLDSTMA